MALELSPSYLLAHRIAVGDVARENTKLPARFDEVERTYRIFGSVQTPTFWDWWEARGRHGFGMSAELEAASLGFFRGGEAVTRESTDEVARSLLGYLHEERARAGLPATIVLALPVVGSRRAMIQAVSRLVDDALDGVAARGSGTMILLRPSDMERAEVIRALQCVMLWAAAEELQGRGRPKKQAEGTVKPSVKLHNIGMRLGLAGEVFDRAMREGGLESRNEAFGDEQVRNEVARKTLPLLEKGWCLIENAARGSFPRSDDLPVDKKWLADSRGDVRQAIWADLDRAERRRLRDEGKLRPPGGGLLRDLVLSAAETAALFAELGIQLDGEHG
jgi:hypothetical protein